MIEEDIERVRELILKEKKIGKEFNTLFNYLKNAEDQEKKMVKDQMERLKNSLMKANDELLNLLEFMNVETPLGKEEEEEKVPEKIPETKVPVPIKGKTEKQEKQEKPKEKLSEFDREVLKRLKKGKAKVIVKKEKKPSIYLKISNNLFGDFVTRLVKQKKLASLEKDLIKSNLGYTSIGYISMLISTTLLSAIIALFIMLFFLFFNLTPDLPIIVRATEAFGMRLLKVFWIIFVVPIGTFLFMYLYPSLEKKSLEDKINQELPFATIHMAAISGSMIEPIKVFNIISSTKEYPNLEREFNKLLNEINVYGYDLVTALKDLTKNTPSQKLGELFNGLATTITSGGNMYDFFDKRSQTLLFDYRLDKEKRTKNAETFMDIYISVVIAAPMILMLLLMMMKISGLGALSTSLILLLIVGGVSLINVFFLIFLQIKQPTGT